MARLAWERSRVEAQTPQAKAIGLDAAIGDPAPWLPDALIAAHAWHWMGGWQPTALPLYCQLHDVDDLDLLAQLLIVIRTHAHG